MFGGFADIVWWFCDCFVVILRLPSMLQSATPLSIQLFLSRSS